MTLMTTFRIDDMTCGHCEKTVAKALAEALPGSTVTVDLAARKAVVEGNAALAEEAIREAGYTPVREG
ncbi:heavy-metal-associated domain-containing protein [Peteryoungia ipomoeae]|uniref:Heavy-metal-associated domain-containing protein n=1 Tax=Peteryoungia ipomoeae TaxID=1210932 RepID=A0A4S8NZ93_9HYPH|nr:heavy-metal-associated domain-containing protein [Peteryoungia ipomoeae]THV22908.1 heavy-metal-associated domain-containing protein [Peteryoungia ipomoeae]